MKAIPYITLAICVSLLVVQQLVLSSGSKSNTKLKTCIAEVKASRGAESAEARGLRATFPAKSSRTGERDGGAADDLPTSLADLDLEAFAKAVMEAEGGGNPNLEAGMRVHSLFLEATAEELAALVTRAAELDLPDGFKGEFIGAVIGALAEKDPRAALELAFSIESDSSQGNRSDFAGAFKKWMEKDPVAALAWYERELAKGSFGGKALDGRQDSHLAFEAAAIDALLGSNPTLARQRLTALPADEHAKVFEQYLRPTPATAIAHAQLLRETLPVDQHAKLLANANREFLHHGEYDQLADYTQQIAASDEERTAIVRSAVQRKFERLGWERQTLTAADFSAMQQFLQAQVPEEEANLIAGETVAHLARTPQYFDQALEFVHEAHRAAPNDDILAGFLTDAYVGNKENQPAARALLEQIADPERREEVRERFNRRHGPATVEE